MMLCPVPCSRVHLPPATDHKAVYALCRWYKVLDRTVMPNNSRSTAAVLLKTAADQVIWAPIMTVVFFAVLKGLEGHPELIWPTIQVGEVAAAIFFACLW